jgi:hypothetical protein
MVRGLGEKQDLERMWTRCRIAFVLAKETCISRELRNIIHPNVLKKQLTSMIDIGIVIKHRHDATDSIPQLQKNIPKNIRMWYTYDYYLLDWSNPISKKCVEVIESLHARNGTKNGSMQESHEIRQKSENYLNRMHKANQDLLQTFGENVVTLARSYVELGYSPLNAFIDFKIMRIKNKLQLRVMHTDLWEALAKSEVLSSSSFG